MLSPEVGKIVEKRHEMILAHEKFGIKEVEKGRETSNVYTNPLTSPQRNPNLDSKRTEPLTAMEILGICSMYCSRLYDEKVLVIVQLKC